MKKGEGLARMRDTFLSYSILFYSILILLGGTVLRKFGDNSPKTPRKSKKPHNYKGLKVVAMSGTYPYATILCNFWTGMQTKHSKCPKTRENRKLPDNSGNSRGIV